MLFLLYVSTAAEYSLPPNVADFAKIIFCVIYVYAILTPPIYIAKIKDLPSYIPFQPIKSFKILFSKNLSPSGKGYFVVVGTINDQIYFNIHKIVSRSTK